MKTKNALLTIKMKLRHAHFLLQISNFKVYLIMEEFYVHFQNIYFTFP